MTAALKFSCSNIAWSPDEEEQNLRFLVEIGVTGIEIAPTALWGGWQNITAEKIRSYRTNLEALGFSAPAIQAITFGLPVESIFNKQDQETLLAHFKQVAEIASLLGAKTAIFGSPKLRVPPDSLSDPESAVLPFFARAAELFHSQGVMLCIEPCPLSYGCKFLTTAQETAAFVKRVGHPGLGLHIDAGALYIAQESLPDLWPSIGPLVKHYHISEPELGDFSNPQAPHRDNLAFLQSINYSGWCSVEMRNSDVSFAERGPWELIRSFI